MRLFGFLCSLIPASSFGNANFGCHVHSLHLWLCLRDDRAWSNLLGGGKEAEGRTGYQLCDERNCADGKIHLPRPKPDPDFLMAEGPT